MKEEEVLTFCVRFELRWKMLSLNLPGCVVPPGFKPDIFDGVLLLLLYSLHPIGELM